MPVSKLTEELTRKLVERLESGVPLELACDVCGVHRGTVLRWVKSNEAFATEITRARAVGKITLFERAKTGDEAGVSYGQSKASLEVLSRIDKSFAPKVNVKVQEELNDLLDVAERVLDPEQFELLLKALAQRELGLGDGLGAGPDTSGEES